mmetsp:Transcript_38687/g.44309  ORF Transcript_38687/g.44309 Transcript_38687/m.44309 type:complete len:87 (-) Transcript_38687:255-515(-)
MYKHNTNFNELKLHNPEFYISVDADVSKPIKRKMTKLPQITPLRKINRSIVNQFSLESKRRQNFSLSKVHPQCSEVDASYCEENPS